MVPISDTSPRYWAFISYCHEDRRAAARLQSAIEKFRSPPDAVASGSLPPHLRPIFRDREVLGSSHDLSAAILEALDDSRALVVVCSPRAASSRWVAAEVSEFIARRGLENIFCLIIDGEPNAADPSLECLPEPLRRAQSGREMLAADARVGADGWRDAVLKIVAGLTRLPFADLARREQRRFRRRALAWSVAGMLLAAVFGALAVQSARSAAAARKSAEDARLIASYLEEVLSQFSPRELDNSARAALLPLIDASAREDRLSRLNTNPAALIRVRYVLASAYLELNAADRARPLFEKNVELATAVLGSDHRETLSNLQSLGNTLNALGDTEGGARIHRQLLDTALRVHGEQSKEAVAAMTNLAISMAQLGRTDEALHLRTRVYEIGRKLFPPDYTNFQVARRSYAWALQQQGKLEEARAVLEELYRDQLNSPGPGNLVTCETEGFLGEFYETLGEPERAAQVYAAAAEGLARIHGDNDSRALFCAFRLTNVLHALGRKREAAAVAKRYFGHPPDPQKLGIIGKKPSDLPL